MSRVASPITVKSHRRRSKSPPKETPAPVEFRDYVGGRTEYKMKEEDPIVKRMSANIESAKLELDQRRNRIDAGARLIVYISEMEKKEVKDERFIKALRSAVSSVVSQYVSDEVVKTKSRSGAYLLPANRLPSQFSAEAAAKYIADAQQEGTKGADGDPYVVDEGELRYRPAKAVEDVRSIWDAAKGEWVPYPSVRADALLRPYTVDAANAVNEAIAGGKLPEPTTCKVPGFSDCHGVCVPKSVPKTKKQVASWEKSCSPDTYKTSPLRTKYLDRKMKASPRKRASPSRSRSASRRRSSKATTSATW